MVLSKKIVVKKTIKKADKRGDTGKKAAKRTSTSTTTTITSTTKKGTGKKTASITKGVDRKSKTNKILGYSALALSAVAGLGFLYKNKDKLFKSKTEQAVDNINKALPQVPKETITSILKKAEKDNSSPQQVIEQIQSTTSVPLNQEQNQIIAQYTKNINKKSKRQPTSSEKSIFIELCKNDKFLDHCIRRININQFKAEIELTPEIMADILGEIQKLKVQKPRWQY